jgi:Family of unknown function (DUF6134)
MRNLIRATRIFGALGAVVGLAGTAAAQSGDTTTLSYAVMRNGSQIGSTIVKLVRDRRQMDVDVATHVQVKIAFLTVYRYEQHETEQWTDGRLQAMSSVTDDNGAVHRVNATSRGNVLAVDADGRIRTVDADVIPASLWNAALVKKTLALDTQDGKLTPVAVVDRGEEQLVLRGHTTLAHHYSINTGFAQDVWYDQQHRLVKVQLHGSDGSQIQYKLG